MPQGLREDSLYARAYWRLRQPLIDLMFDGVAWDAAAAEREKQRLEEKKNALKLQLDQLTGGIRLYTVHRHRSKLLVGLYAEQKRLAAACKGLGKSEDGRLRRADLKLLQLRIKEVRNSDDGIELEIAPGLSGKSIAEYLYGKKEDGGLGLPAKMKRRKDSGKSTVTVDDTALQKLALVYQNKPTASGTLGDLIKAIRDHRRAEKLVSTYLNPDKMLSPVDGRFHSTYKTFGTQTGRLSSSSDPWDYGGNAQNQDREFKWLFLPG